MGFRHALAARSTCSRPRRPKPGEPDLRGFEWYYWRRQAHGERTVRKLSGVVASSSSGCSFSPDASLAGFVAFPIGRSHTGKLLVHDTATGKLLYKIPFQLPTVNNDVVRIRSFRIAFSADSQVVALINSQPLSAEVTNAGNQDWEIQTIRLEPGRRAPAIPRLGSGEHNGGDAIAERESRWLKDRRRLGGA